MVATPLGFRGADNVTLSNAALPPTNATEVIHQHSLGSRNGKAVFTTVRADQWMRGFLVCEYRRELNSKPEFWVAHPHQSVSSNVRIRAASGLG